MIIIITIPYKKEKEKKSGNSDSIDNAVNYAWPNSISAMKWDHCSVVNL